MDDFLNSQPTKKELINLSLKMIKLLAAASFRLTKWISNDRDVIKSLPSSEISDKIVNLDLKSHPCSAFCFLFFVFLTPTRQSK